MKTPDPDPKTIDPSPILLSPDGSGEDIAQMSGRHGLRSRWKLHTLSADIDFLAVRSAAGSVRRRNDLRLADMQAVFIKSIDRRLDHHGDDILISTASRSGIAPGCSSTFYTWVPLLASTGGWMMSYFRMRLPGGTLKVKPYAALRSIERERRVPVLRVGPFYLVWRANHRRGPSQKKAQPTLH